MLPPFLQGEKGEPGVIISPDGTVVTAQVKGEKVGVLRERGGTNPFNGCQVVLVVTPFPSPLSTGGARAARTNGTLGKSPSPSSSYRMGRDGADPRQRRMGMPLL